MKRKRVDFQWQLQILWQFSWCQYQCGVQQVWAVCVCQSSLTWAISVNCVGFLCPYCNLGTSPESLECCCIISWVSVYTDVPFFSVTVWKLHSFLHSQSLTHFQSHCHLPPGCQHLSSTSLPLMKQMLLFQPVWDPKMTQNWKKWVHFIF